jgi:hypothetical protein
MKLHNFLLRLMGLGQKVYNFLLRLLGRRRVYNFVLRLRKVYTILRLMCLG